MLTFSLLLGMLPMAARAIDISGRSFNPSTSELRVDFDLQLTQPLDINIYVEDAGGETLFGKLITGVELPGYDGAFIPHDPCTGLPLSTGFSLPRDSAAPDGDIYAPEGGSPAPGVDPAPTQPGEDEGTDEPQANPPSTL